MSPIDRQLTVLLAMLALASCLLAGAVLGSLGSASRLGVALAAAGLPLMLGSLVLAWRTRRQLLAAFRQLKGAVGALGMSSEQPDIDASALPAELADALTELRQRTRDNELSRAYLDRVLCGMNEAIFVVDSGGRIELANEAAAELSALPLAELAGVPIAEVLRLDANGPTAPGADSKPFETEVVRPDGSAVCVSYTKSDLLDEQGGVRSSVYAAQNIDERKKTEQRIRYLAQTDALTKIANRMEFQHRLQQSLARARRNNHYVALLYLDVDRFKDINDTFGHAAGDRSLEMFANRISAALPEGSIPGRLAGDEFCVILPSQSNIEELTRAVNTTAEQLLSAVSKPFDVEDEEIFMSTSAGVTIYPRDADNVVDLLRNADAAMYHAKRAGGNCFEFYETHMNSPAEERLKLKSKLSRAFERNELRLHYQPKYRLADGKVAGAEALVRWDLPDHGLVFPSDFIPLAEESNLILQIGDWVLDRVCADYREWQRIIPSPCRIAVNLSLRQLQQQRFLEGVRKVFRRHSVSPTCLELEITETTLMEDTRATTRILDALYGMGLNLAIDDFGTGYSSLSALQQFPISTLKIDRSFIEDLAIDKDNAAIVRTIVQMAHSLKLEVVAEGVETQAQLDFLRSHGCDYAQGHLFGDPMTAARFARLLAEDAEGSGRYRALFA